MDWHDFVKNYVWDAQKTPYFTKVPNLNREQAQHETFIYAIFLGSIFFVVTLASIADVFVNGNSASIVAVLYGLALFAAALSIGLVRHLYAAVLGVSAPVVVFLYFLIVGFHPNLIALDKYALLGFCLLWLWYTVRVVAICKRYPRMRPREFPADDE